MRGGFADVLQFTACDKKGQRLDVVTFNLISKHRPKMSPVSNFAKSGFAIF
jgi:hypothetical protein